MNGRAAGLCVLGGLLVAALGALGVALGDPPHLDADDLDGWLALYAIGLLAALGAMPFVLHRRYSSRTEDSERRWELALAAWGGIALAAALGFVVLGVVAGFAATSAFGSLALVGIAECALVVAGLMTLVLTTG